MDCSSSCSATFNNKLKEKKVIKSKCLNCGKKLISKRIKKYCNNKCQGELKSKSIVKKAFLAIENNNNIFKSIDVESRWKKKYLIEKHGNKCMNCDWCEVHPITGNIPIQLNHIDGDSDNNKLNNLELLCPNCHSLTFNYGNLNKGNGRNERKRYRNYLKKLTIDELLIEKNKK